MGTDAWHDETHGRGPDDLVGEIERRQLPWKEKGKDDDKKTKNEEPKALPQTEARDELKEVFKKN